MTVKVKYSNSFNAKKKRIERLPKLMGSVIKGSLKGDAKAILKFFHDGIKDEMFNLIPLAESTIKAKQGMSQPTTPLYGKGDDAKDKSYVNMLRLRQLKNGWMIYPSNAKHWKSDLKLKDLFQIHEYGCKILMPNGTIVQIPPRPAFLLAYQAYMREKRKNKKETSVHVKQAIVEYINTANNKHLEGFIKLTKVKDKEEE